MNRIVKKTWLLTFVFVSAVTSAIAAPKSIVCDLKIAKSKNLPVYDISYIWRRIAREWYPPRDSGTCTMSFGFDSLGRPWNITATDGNEFRAAEQAAKRAIENAKIVPMKLDGARVVVRFDYLSPGVKGKNVDVVLPADAKAPKVSFINTGTISSGKTVEPRLAAAQENNRGVERYLGNDKDGARRLFDSALEAMPTYEPAIFNKKLIESQK